MQDNHEAAINAKTVTQNSLPSSYEQERAHIPKEIRAVTDELVRRTANRTLAVQKEPLKTIYDLTRSQSTINGVCFRGDDSNYLPATIKIVSFCTGESEERLEAIVEEYKQSIKGETVTDTMVMNKLYQEFIENHPQREFIANQLGQSLTGTILDALIKNDHLPKFKDAKEIRQALQRFQQVCSKSRAIEGMTGPDIDDATLEAVFKTPCDLLPLAGEKDSITTFSLRHSPTPSGTPYLIDCEYSVKDVIHFELAMSLTPEGEGFDVRVIDSTLTLKDLTQKKNAGRCRSFL